VSHYFDSGREKFDWVILDLMIVIECHGQQHYKPVCFGGIPEEEAKIRFQEQVLRDLKKMQAAQKAGWTYIIFKYDEKDITPSILLDKVAAAEQQLQNGTDRNQVFQEIKKKRKGNRNEDYHKKQLKRAREYHREQYRKQKTIKDAQKKGNNGHD